MGPIRLWEASPSWTTVPGPTTHSVTMPSRLAPENGNKTECATWLPPSTATPACNTDSDTTLPPATTVGRVGVAHRVAWRTVLPTTVTVPRVRRLTI